MRGEPLHICSKDHQPTIYTGAECPICALVKRLNELANLTESLVAEIRELKKQEKPV